jgi:Flp pilus assembly protein TadD
VTTSSSTPMQAIVNALQSNQLIETEMRARNLLAAEPGNTNAMFYLAVALMLQDRNAEAVDILRCLTRLEPDLAVHHNNLGTALREIGDLDDAEVAYRRGLALNPENAAALSNLGSLRWQRGDAVETRELMLEAWRIDPDLPEPRIYGAPACLKCADNEMAEKLLEGCESWPYLGPALEADLGANLIQIERLGEAERRLRELMKHPEAESIARLRLAALMERVNRLDEAELLLDGGNFSPLDEREEQTVRATLASRRGRLEEAIPLYCKALGTTNRTIKSADAIFALAKAYDGVGNTALAMKSLREGHELQLAHAGRLMPKLLEPDSNPLNIVDYPVSREAFDRWQPDPGAPSAEASPIFILGFPRSGTTLLEQMIEAHPGMRSMDERAFLQNVITRMQSIGDLNYPDDLDQLGPADLEDMRTVYWQCVAGVLKLGDGERLVDKNPLNVLRLPLIHRIFPNARIILALRHPCDVLLSNYMQCFHAPAYQILCSSFQRLAKGYSDAMNFWIVHARMFDAAIMELRYEDLLDDPDAQIARIAEHLHLHDADALRGFREHARAKGFISTPSYSQVVEPLTKKAVGRWHRYREFLDPVLPVLKPAMERWGYES